MYHVSDHVRDGIFKSKSLRQLYFLIIWIRSTGDFPVVEVAIPSGIILLVLGILIVICCMRKQRKRPEEKQEEVDADENPVYGVYQLSETYERQYSTDEAVDNNDYYGQ